jgi:CSLREA domain-containing protein
MKTHLSTTGRIFVVIVLALGMGGVPLHSARASTTWTVNSTADTGSGDCESICTLRLAIVLAQSGDTIVFDSTLSGSIDLTDYLPPINYDLTIHGSPTVTINANGNRVFSIASGASVTLDGLIIENGDAGGNVGGAIESWGTLTIDDTSIKNNSATNGGAIYIGEGTLTLTGSTLESNTATQYGGGIYISSGTVTISNSTIKQNSAVFDGGGIFTISLNLLTITDSTFDSNSVCQDGCYGGGIIANRTGELLITGSTFSGNSATEGGGIFGSSGTTTISNSTFTGNSSSDLGGGIYTYGTLNLTNSTFSGNSATGSGEAGADVYIDYSELNFANTIMANAANGGNCYVHEGTIGTNTNNLVEDGSCSTTYSGDPFLAPLADNGGPTQTMALLPGSPAIDTGNAGSAPATDQRGVSRPQGAGVDIGAYELRTCTVTTSADGTGPIPAGSLREKIGDTNCDVIIFDDDYTITLASRLDITRNLTIDGSGLSSPVTISGPDEYSGPAYRLFYVSPGTQAILKSLVLENGVNGSLYNGGGAIYNMGHLQVQDSTFQNNDSVVYHGGAIHNTGILEVRDSTFQGNHSGSFGGAIYSTGTLEVDSSFFTKSPLSIESANNGGAIYNDGGTATISLSTFDTNSSADGGAVTNASGIMTVTDSTFTNNSASTHGGAIMNSIGNLIVKASTLEGNSASEGGGISTTGVSEEEKLTVANSTLQGNTASDVGGGIYISGDAELDNNTIAGNSSTSDLSGGGIHINSGTLDFSNNIIANSLDGYDCFSPYGVGVNHNNFIGDGSCNSSNTSDLIGFQSGEITLGDLQDNGGPTETMALLPGSPAIDAGDDAICAAAPVNNLDQRGVIRPQGNHCDIGAYEAQLYSVPLVTGWNLVSTRLHPVDTSISSVLSSISGQYSLVYAWDAANSKWLIYDPSLGALNDLNSLDERLGFWIKVSSNPTLVVSGRIPVNPSITLKDGWNLVGYPSATNAALPDVLSNHGVGTDFSLVYAYHASDGSVAWKLYDRTGNPLLNDLTELSPGWGYWIKASADHAWSVP